MHRESLPDGSAMELPRGSSVGLDRFGASAPAEVVFEELGFTPEPVADRARALLAAAR